MRFSSAALPPALKGDFNFRFVADVMLDGNRLVQDVPFQNPRFIEDGTSQVQGTGSCTVVWQDDFGLSIAPRSIGDVLSPFGAQLWVSVIVTVGETYTERIPYGKYLLAATPSIVTQRFAFNGGVLSKGDLVDLELKDLFNGILGDRFDTPGAAPSLTSTWTEVQRLAQLPVTRSITDAAISTTVAYQEDKLQAIYDLATGLDAVAYMTADGSVSMRPNVWPAAVDTLSSAQVDDQGTLISVGRAMSNDTVYNKVVVRDSSADGSPILASAEITSGPLRTANSDGSLSPYRRKPVYVSSPYITTQLQAQAYADQQLPRVSQLRAVSIDLVETFNPLREVGDVLTIRRFGEQFLARVSKIQRDDSGQMTTTVTVNP